MQATTPTATAPYPARLEGHLEQPSRWLWLVKWLLAIPHFVILVFLWLAFSILALVAFFAVLFSGRYPRGIFGFNVGVMRWSWRVAFYCFGANGTDRYPPFTLADVPDYPARLDVAYPTWQRKGFRLIGWWLAGIPQYLVATVFAGGGFAGWSASERWPGALSWGLIGLLVFVSLLVLLVRGTYPRSIFDFVLGLDRWVLRVTAYAAVMTPEYPPFRVDPGEDEPGGLSTRPVPAAPSEAQAPGRGWSFGRVLAVVLGSLAILLALAALAGGTAAVAFDQTQRDSAGYLMTGSKLYTTDTYALVSDGYRTGGPDDWIGVRDVVGDVRVRSQSGNAVFVGIGPAAAVDLYLANVRREVASNFGVNRDDFRLRDGGAPPTPPGAQSFWAAQSVGSGTQTLTWTPESGRWRVVVMNADGTPAVAARLSIGARFPHLLGIGLGALGAGVLLLAAGAGAIYGATARAGGA